MREIFPNIYEVLPSRPTPSKYRSFFVKRAAGNLLFPCFSNQSTIEAQFDAIAALGGLSHQLLGDSHFRSAHCDDVAARFGAALYCSVKEAPDVTRKVSRVEVFPFERHYLTDDIEVIPTPGHRPGGVCFLLSLNEQRYLFAGDFIWHNGSTWIPTPATATTRAYSESLRLVESLGVNALLVNTQLSNPTFSISLSPAISGAWFSELSRQIPSKG